MELFVQKYGGTSVANMQRIGAVARRVAACRARGQHIVVVVSAMAGDTDRLIDLCGDAGNDALRERDAVISTGEQVTAGLLALTLMRMGVAARSMTGAQIGIRTDGAHGKARILDIRTDALLSTVSNGAVAVVPGFQGYTAAGDVATLGRGGSDTTAVALAAALSAKECQIFTDVDGIYTTDPRVCKDARRLPAIHMEEMLEMASMGSKVLQIRSVEMAGKHRVPLRVLSSLTDDDTCAGGTLITYGEDKMEEPLVTGIAFNRDEAKITIAGVPDKPGIAHRIIEAVSDAAVNVDMIVQNIGSDSRTDFSFTVHRDDYAQALAVTRGVARDIGAGQVLGDDAIGKVSIVGIGMRSHAGVASKMFKTLSDCGVNIQMISTSEIKVSVVIDGKSLDAATQALHAAFELGKEPADETN